MRSALAETRTRTLRPSASDPFLPRSLVSQRRRIFERGYRWVAGGVSVSAAAWIGSLLLILWYFYLITPISVLANLTVVPIAFCLLGHRDTQDFGRKFKIAFSGCEHEACALVSIHDLGGIAKIPIADWSLLRRATALAQRGAGRD